MYFSALGLSPSILKALDEAGYQKPTAIQLQAIPAILQGKNVMAAAQTGTGKTAGFTLPILELLSKKGPVEKHVIRALVLAPTRELAAQVAESIQTYGKHLPLRSTVVFGGVKINPQISKLQQGVDILVATPGRLLDLHNQKAMRLDQVDMLVLDEADRMLDMGFIHDIKKIISLLPTKRQNLLFSATFSNEIRTLAKSLMHNAVEISATPANTTVNTVKQCVYTVDKKQKMGVLSHLIWEGRWEQVLVFTKTKHGANRLAQQLEDDGIHTTAIHGNKSQGARTKALANFKAGNIRVLVATDIAARGLDIELLPHVVNFDLPQVTEDYIHRIGRTGRAGATGEAISLVSADEARQLAEIERLIKQKLPRKTIDKFEPQHVVPETRIATTNKPKNNDRHYRAHKKQTRFHSRDNNTETRDGKINPHRNKSRKPFSQDERETRYAHNKKSAPFSKSRESREEKTDYRQGNFKKRTARNASDARRYRDDDKPTFNSRNETHTKRSNDKKSKPTLKTYGDRKYPPIKKYKEEEEKPRNKEGYSKNDFRP